MDIPAIEKKILDHKLKKTSKEYDFGSFNDLCRALDITPVKSSGQRKALEVQLRRFFDFERVPGTNKIKITGTHYGKPLPYVTKREGVHWTALNRPIACLIMLNTKLIGRELTKKLILENIGIMREEPKSKSPRWNTRHSYDAYMKKMYDGLGSAMTQLSKAKYMTFKERYVARTKTKSEITLTAKQIADYKSTCKNLLKTMHLDNLWTATYTKQRKSYRDELDKELMTNYGFNNVSTRYLIDKGPKYDLDAFKNSYPIVFPVPSKMLNGFIRADAEANFWDSVATRVSNMKDIGIGIVDAEHYAADIAEIRANI